MAKVTIYTTPTCPYCTMAKQLLEQKKVEFIEIDVGSSVDMRKEMENRSGRHTVPQIFIADAHVGGCDDLYELEQNQELDLMLNNQ